MIISSYFRKLKVPYVYQFLRKFQPETIVLCSTIDFFVTKNHQFLPAPLEAVLPAVRNFDRAVNCQPSYRAAPLIAEARTHKNHPFILSHIFLLLAHQFSQKTQYL